MVTASHPEPVLDSPHPPSPPTAAIRADDDAERVLIDRIGAGDRDAFRELYQQYHRRLARFLTRVTRRYEDAEEIINDTLWIVWQRAREYRGASQVSTWIMGIAYRRALNQIRRAATHDRILALHSSDGEGLVNEPGRALEDRQLLDHALAQLPLEQRMALEFTYYFDHSCEEIADIMECPVNTVKTRMFNARRKLRVLLGAGGTTPGAHP
jgi:RNA polymerase sigma-70 factor (ECF subfamily)